jgi:hypothetical protein
MSLSVNNPRSGRSRSPGGRDDRSRSRDARAPSPAAQPVKSSKTKKYYESDSTESSSDSESDHRSSQHRHEERRYEEDSKYKRPSGKYVETTDTRYEKDRRDGKQTSYSESTRYESTRPADYARHPSYSRPSEAPSAPHAEYAVPGQYKWDDHHEEKGGRPPAAAQERERGVSLNTSGGFHMDIGHGPPQPRYASDTPDQRTYSATATITAGRGHYEVPEKYKYAETPQQITYVNKTEARKPSYTQTPHPQMEIDRRRREAEVEVEVKRRTSQYKTEVEIDDRRVDDRRSSRLHGEVEVDLGRRPSRRTEEIEIESGRRPSRREEELKIEERRPARHSEVEVDLDLRRTNSRRAEEIEYEERRPSRHTAEVEVDLHRRPSRRTAEVEIEERRPGPPSRHTSEVDIDVVRRSSHADGEYERRRTSTVVEVHPGGGSLHAPASPGLGVHRLSISAGAAAGALSLAAPGQHSLSHGAPPGSPLLEAYHGTYQSISPMPSPMMLPSKYDSELSDIEPLDSDAESHKPLKSVLKKKQVIIYDPEPDALAIAQALNHHTPRVEPIVSILSRLSDDHVMALRMEYKKHIKVGGKGINIAKHIKLKIPGNLGKVAYATALGRWESEAHWANFWYQSGSSRRELLIESLMGRTNAEIRAVKEAFSDKRYNDSLEKCMQTELKKDKFRYAVLLALEERKSELQTVSKTAARRDAEDLYKALMSKEGGETAMIDIIVVRSDNHLREVLKDFELRYKKNFAKAMIEKSRNLVVRAPHLSLLISPLS